MDYSEIIQKQTNYFNSNTTKKIDFRITQLQKLKSVIMSNESVLYKAIYTDFKKSETETYASELGYIYHEIDESIKNIAKWAKRKKVKTSSILQPAKSYIIPEPLGVCLIIGAWNYPYQLSLVPVVAAISAGNTIVLKPSEISPSTSAAMAKMLNENFSSEFITVIEGGITETSALLEQKFDKIFFTGGTAIGKIVYQAAAKHLTPVTLELGGKSPAIVTKNCNVEHAAKRLIRTKFLNAGQTCIAPDYVLVDEKVKEELLSHLKQFIIKYEFSFDKKNYVQIVNERNFNRLVGLIDKNKIHHGGETNFEQRYIAPTLLTNITFDDKIMEDEIFGPILPIISYTDLNAAISKIKSKPKPLACYIFTNAVSVKNKLLNELSFGGGTVNDSLTHFSNSNLPFGGVGSSGMGSYHGEFGFTTFSHFKSIVDKNMLVNK